MARRAQDGGLTAERFNDERGPGIRLRFAEQRVRGATRVIRAEQQATEFLSVPFEFGRLVPDYGAVFDTRDGSVEARVVSAQPFMVISGRYLDLLPEGHRMTSPDGEASIEYRAARDVTELLTVLRPTPRAGARHNTAVFRFRG